ncbi:hypothetical protein TNCV_1404291 [Trichonephila clavipes]|nr:hypothetical protein TNCV_1404291 [Trichonephila clavipes]
MSRSTASIGSQFFYDMSPTLDCSHVVNVTFPTRYYNTKSPAINFPKISSITSDPGTSADKRRNRKNAVVTFELGTWRVLQEDCLSDGLRDVTL